MRLLFISAGTSVTDPVAGDQIRAWNIIKGLHNEGWHINLLENHGGDPSIPEANVNTFKHILSPRLNDLNPYLYRALVSQFRAQPPDIVHVKTFSGVTATKIVSKFSQTESSVVYDAQNFEAEKIETAKSSLVWYKRIISPYLIPGLEWLSVRVADHVVTVSNKDRDSFRDRFNVPEHKITVIPSGSDLVDGDESKADQFRSEHDLPMDKSLLVFHGDFEYPPNRDAIEAIVDKVLPNLDSKTSDYHFAIAGRNSPSFQDRSDIDGLGFVEDLDTFLTAGDIAVVPLDKGGGTKLKMLDYICAGLPIVTTEKGAEGIDLLDGESALVFDSVDKAFVDGIVDLIEDQQCRDNLGSNARELAESTYTWESIVPQIDSLYTSLMDT